MVTCAVEYLVDTASGCWLWQRAIAATGYGTIGSRYAHRVYYERHRGSITPGMQVDHLCRVRRCVNPSHLEIVTPTENKLRGMSPNAINARKTHCDRGHEFTAENTYVRRDSGTRQCRACKAERDKARPSAWVRRGRVNGHAAVPRVAGSAVWTVEHGLTVPVLHDGVQQATLRSQGR